MNYCIPIEIVNDIAPREIDERSIFDKCICADKYYEFDDIQEDIINIIINAKIIVSIKNDKIKSKRGCIKGMIYCSMFFLLLLTIIVSIIISKSY